MASIQSVLLDKPNLLPQACCRDAQTRSPEQETNEWALWTALTFRHREKTLAESQGGAHLIQSQPLGGKQGENCT